ncbi:hypothetical protein PAPYR_3462 [Paratrimastix pyriformis]|uniref:Adhesin domain-containing protein n=1 Tax=Paratrimastix pyriformis TaxID=342808 RepID=A0ABQ8USU1_9EUKA|nr:hypothetical protein PAPYR_3462 [Paratrimastix pyriformis]|eukprot:GAFH01001620.1.p1 GENE.GAFH01001620.1~~GAFH01001620.1.p1  ORF type:complete len:461 (+),score=-23.93 GAFH01001620.1:29-1411(+)
MNSQPSSYVTISVGATGPSTSFVPNNSEPQFQDPKMTTPYAYSQPVLYPSLPPAQQPQPQMVQPQVYQQGAGGALLYPGYPSPSAPLSPKRSNPPPCCCPCCCCRSTCCWCSRRACCCFSCVGVIFALIVCGLLGGLIGGHLASCAQATADVQPVLTYAHLSDISIVCSTCALTVAPSSDNLFHLAVTTYANTEVYRSKISMSGINNNGSFSYQVDLPNLEFMRCAWVELVLSIPAGTSPSLTLTGTIPLIRGVTLQNLNIMGSFMSIQTDHVTCTGSSVRVVTSTGTQTHDSLTTTGGASVVMTTSAGTLRVTDSKFLGGGSVGLKASAGSLRLETATLDCPLTATTSMGGVSLSDLTFTNGSALVAEVTSGSLHIERPVGFSSVRTKTSAGSTSITLRSYSMHGSFSLTASSGSVSASGPTISTSSSSNNKLTGTVGGGGAQTIECTSSAGSISLSEE